MTLGSTPNKLLSANGFQWNPRIGTELQRVGQKGGRERTQSVRLFLRLELEKKNIALRKRTFSSVRPPLEEYSIHNPALFDGISQQ